MKRDTGNWGKNSRQKEQQVQGPLAFSEVTSGAAEEGR